MSSFNVPPTGFPASQEHIRLELEQIKPHIEELTGLSSQWNGKVTLISNALFKGLKPYICDIRIGDRFTEADERWTTFIHELLHASSIGYNRVDFEENVGWEEGVVEKLQRLLRDEICARIDVVIAQELLDSLDAGHPFNRYIEALEQVRLVMVADELPFYLSLLQTPIKERYGALIKQALQFPGLQRASALRILSSANVVLKQGRRERL